MIRKTFFLKGEDVKIKIPLEAILEVIKIIISKINKNEYEKFMKREMDFEKELKLISRIIALIYNSIVSILDDGIKEVKIYFPYFEKKVENNKMSRILKSLKNDYDELWILFNHISKDLIRIIIAINENDKDIFKNNFLKDLFIYNYIEIYKENGDIEIYSTLIDNDTSELIFFKINNYVTFYYLGKLAKLNINPDRKLNDNITISEIENEIEYLNDNSNTKLLFYKIAEFIINSRKVDKKEIRNKVKLDKVKLFFHIKNIF